MTNNDKMNVIRGLITCSELANRTKKALLDFVELSWLALPMKPYRNDIDDLQCPACGDFVYL